MGFLWNLCQYHSAELERHAEETKGSSSESQFPLRTKKHLASEFRSSSAERTARMIGFITGFLPG
jgi:hypothetical protein